MTFSTLGTDTTTNQPVYLYKASRTQGLYIVGLQGMGKSGLLENLIIDDIKQGLGVCVLDPHGELIDHVIARLPGKAEEEKVIYLDLAEEDYFFGLNLFECADPTNNRKVSFTRSQVLHVFEKAYEVSQPATPRIYDYLFNTAYTLITNPGYTLLEIPLVFNAACRQKLLLNVSSEAVHKFWDDYKHLPQQKQDEEARELLRRLNDLSDDPLRYIVGQSQSTINLQKIMDGGKILLVKLSRRLEQATSLIGSIIVALILNASAARTTHKQFHLYADEFQRFATEDFATLLEEARKAGIGITMAHQNRAQLELSDKQADKQLKARTLNVGSLVVFRVPTDANELAGQFDTTPQEAWEQLIEEESVELLKEEWFEPITDVIEDGVEEIKTPVSNPFDWLVSGNSHSNPVVSRYADNTLRKIHLALPLNDPLRKIIRSELNSYLYRAMTSSDPLTFLCEKSSLNFLIRLNYVYPFGDYYFKETVVASLPEVETSLVSTGRYVRLPIGHIPEDAFHLMPALMAKKKRRDKRLVCG